MMEYDAAAIARRHVGTPYIPGETDCWSIARMIWREYFGWEVPAIGVAPERLRDVLDAFGGHPHRTLWSPVDKPVDGDAVLMGRSMRPCHVGVWLAGGVLHALEGIGTVHTRPERLIGLRVLGYYRYTP